MDLLHRKTKKQTEELPMIEKPRVTNSEKTCIKDTCVLLQPASVSVDEEVKGYLSGPAAGTRPLPPCTHTSCSHPEGAAPWLTGRALTKQVLQILTLPLPSTSRCLVGTSEVCAALGK